MELLLGILRESWVVMEESAPYMFLGFIAAGLLKGFLPGDLVQRHLGGSRVSNIFKASLFGVPIPLCSCGVLPAAAGIRKQGAGKGATSSFLISTPETGVDSIAVTYALLDPLMTVFRPLAAFFTAIFTGIFVEKFDGEESGDGILGGPGKAGKHNTSAAHNASAGTPMGDLRQSAAPQGSTHGPEGTTGNDAAGATSHDHLQTDHSHGEEDCGCDGSCDITSRAPASGLQRLRSGLGYAFGELLADIGSWFLIGVVVAGAISALLPPDAVADWLGEGFLAMAAMLVLAVPMYVCATASTPIAAALALKGLSPGAAIVFLLAGPATNAAGLAVVSRILGRKGMVVYLAGIVVCSLALGMFGNWLYGVLGMDLTGWVKSSGEELRSWWHTASAVLLLALIGYHMTMARIRKWRGHENCDCHGH